MSRVVLVTGGSRGIGRACALAFEALGDHVAVTYCTKPVEDMFALECDVRDDRQVRDAVATVEAEFGTVDVLVSCAGIIRDRLLVRMSEHDFTDVVDVNLSGAYRMARQVMRPMIRQRSGRIVFVSSVAGHLGSSGQANYGASKMGLVGLARSLAREVGARGITVNVVAPGAVLTDILDPIPDSRLEQIRQAVPLGRFGELHEIASVVTFLASPEAGYVTGAVVPVDGGLAMGL